MKARLFAFLLLFAIACREKDVYPPEIKLSGDPVIAIFRKDSFTDPGAKGSDFIGNGETRDISNRIMRIGEVDILSAGQYELTYELTDEAGNNAEAQSRTVVVKHNPEGLLGSYRATDSCTGGQRSYILQIDSVLPGNKVRTINFENRSGPAFFSLRGSFNGEVFLESQSIGNITYAGSGNISEDGSEIFLRYTSFSGSTVQTCESRLRRP